MKQEQEDIPGNIEVTISTTHFEDELPKRHLHGLKALLQTILESVDGYILSRHLTEKHGSRSARFLAELRTVLGDVLEVKFVPAVEDTEPASVEEKVFSLGPGPAAGEEEIAGEETVLVILKTAPVGIDRTLHEEYLGRVFEAALNHLPGPILGEPVVDGVRILPKKHTWMITPDREK